MSHWPGGRGVWGVVDPVAGPYAETITSLIRDGGQLVVYSRLGGMTASVGVADLLYRRVTVRHRMFTDAVSLAWSLCIAINVVACCNAPS